MAGTIGGTTYGVAKGVQLHAVRVLDCTGWGDWSWVIAGVNYAPGNLFADYLNGLYLLDPFHSFALKSPAAGVYRLEEVAPDNFRDTEYCRRYFSRNVVTDELQFLLPLPQGTLSLALGSQRRFSRITSYNVCYTKLLRVYERL